MKALGKLVRRGKDRLHVIGVVQQQRRLAAKAQGHEVALDTGTARKEAERIAAVFLGRVPQASRPGFGPSGRHPPPL